MNDKKPHEYLALRNPGFMTINSVIYAGGKIDNEQPINDFFENIDLNYPSRIIVERYTVEGEPMFKIIEYNGKSIKYIKDSSKTIDKNIKAYKGNNYKVKYEADRIDYDLYKNDKFVTNMISYKK